MARRTGERWELVQTLRAQGKGIKPITRETGPAKRTVHQLHAEIRQRGYPGSYSTVRDYLQPLRELDARP